MDKKPTQEDYYNYSLHILNQNKNFILNWNDINADEIVHRAQIGASILMTKDNFLKGGGFVKAVLNNDLKGVFDRADNTLLRAIRFLVHMREERLSSIEPNFKSIRGNDSVFEI